MTLPAQPSFGSLKPVLARRVLVDLLIALLLLIASGVWASVFWKDWTAFRGSGVFYQTYFEPAVMVACGKGFVIADVQPKPLEDFLFQRRDALTCEEIPADTQLGTRHLYQGAWRYLLVSVGLAWRVLGISWSGMGPLFGAIFGVVIALAYGIFRLGMGRVLAVAGTVCLAASSMHLLNLPHLRDYAKAPFTLALVLLLGVLVTRPVRRGVILGLSAACGLVLGIGYGFRSDFLVNLPVPIVAIFAFLDGGLFRNLRLKSVAAALFLATFFVVSWPVTSTVYTSGGCQWHVSLLGLQAPFDSDLGIAPAPYDFGYAYSDSYIDRAVNGYYWRSNPTAPGLIFCSHEYDVQSGQYLRALVTAFPADLIARSYASILQVVELPLQNSLPPLNGWFAGLYAVRYWVISQLYDWGLWLAVMAVLVTAASSVRLGAFVLFFLGYFGGYPAIQFQERHYFHLEFMGWWAAGFVVQQAILAARGAFRRCPERRVLIRGVGQAVALGAIAAIFLGGGLFTARWYQSRQVSTLLRAYISAPKTSVESIGGPLSGIAPTAWPQLLAVELDQNACGERPSVTFRYDKTDASQDFTRTVTIMRGSKAPGSTRVFVPVFDRYAGLEVSDARPGCVTGVYRLTDLQPFPILLGATLPPDWESLPLYQRLAKWERSSPE